MATRPSDSCCRFNLYGTVRNFSLQLLLFLTATSMTTLLLSILCLATVTAQRTVEFSSQGSIRNYVAFNSTGRVPSRMQQAAHFKEWREREEPRRKARMQERRTKAKEFLQKIPQPDPEDLELVSQKDFAKMDAKRKERGLSWFGGNTDTSAYSAGVMADPAEEYDMWAQAYRMLGGFIDCDHNKDGGGGSHNSNENKQAEGACSRWMMWAAVSVDIG